MNGRLQWILLAICLGQATGLSVQPQSYDTIVVGLGAAGATAASTLARAGRRVLALEAQDRIGGRVMTVPFGDGVVELGAEWIHGTEGSSVYELAVRNNVSILFQNSSFRAYRSDGSEASEQLLRELVEYGIDAEDDAPKEAQRMGEFLTRKLTDYIKKKHPDLLQDQGFMAEFLELMNFLVNSLDASSDWNQISTDTSYRGLEGPQTMSWHRHGYKTFFELLLNTYKNGSGLPNLEIKLGTEVTQIKWPKDSTGSVEVTCKDGAVYTADNVIVTVSLGVLKERYESLFTPPLPADKVAAITKLSFGVVGKTIFSFAEQWWWPDVSMFLLFWNPEDRQAYEQDPWMLQMKQIFRPMGSSNTLTFWANGDVAKQIETLPEEEVKTKLMGLLRKFMGKNTTIPEPTGMIRSKWYSNPFTRGTYGYDNLEYHDHPGRRATLAEPLLDATGSPKVLFAGEATEPEKYSTVHGASDSGLREARRLLPDTKT